MPPKRKRSQATNGSGAAETAASPQSRAHSRKQSKASQSSSLFPEGFVHPHGFHTNPPPIGRPVRVYADGVFDLFHLGHMRQLEQAKNIFPNTYLTVGVTGNSETHRRKGLTVLTAAERAESVRHCKWVDEVIEDCPWVVTPEFVEVHKFDYIAHDDLPYGAAEGDDIYAPIKERGQFLVTQRTEGVSTTGIITKIVRDYEKYIGRQLKRGTSRQELNISWLKKNELDLKRHIAELRDAIRTNWTTTGAEVTRDLRNFWTPSRPSSPSRFISPFARPQKKAASSENLPNGVAGRMSSSPSVSAVAHLGHLESQGSQISRPTSPTSPTERKERADFATGYALGLMGGVQSWMSKNKRNVLSDSAAASDESEEVDGQEATSTRGRKRRKVGEEAERTPKSGNKAKISS